MNDPSRAALSAALCSHQLHLQLPNRARELSIAGEFFPGPFAVTGGALLTGHLQTSSTAALRTSESLAP